MANTARKDQQDARAERPPAPGAPPRAVKLTTLLVTSDDGLWPHVGRELREDLQLKQVDTVEDLVASVPAGQSAIVLWDARAEEAPAGALSRLQLHSAQFATVALGDADTASTWNPMIARGQLVAYVPAPFDSVALHKAIDAAASEVAARAALLGSGTPAPVQSAARKSNTRWLAAALGLGLLAAAGAAYWKFSHAGPDKPDGGATAGGATTVGGETAAADAAQAQAMGAASTDDKIFRLLETAAAAMRERHYIDPAAGSALALYHEVLLYDPNNDEARQGMQRLAEILFSRVQTALDERKFDVALQSLETARSIDPSDRRIAAIDARIAAMRSEIGAAQIIAALNAQAFDRADQLLDEVVRNKSLPDAKVAQLREQIAHRRAESQIDGLLKLVDARLQQDRLVDPHNDNATYYLEEARRAGAGAAVLQARTQELARRLHAHDAGAAANAPPKPKADEPSASGLVQARLDQGQILEPEHDNALFYLKQLSAADPANSGLPALTSAVQTQILARATAAAAAGQADNAKALLDTAASLGATPEIAALRARLNAAARPADAAPAAIPILDANQLQAIDRLNPEYPHDALVAGTEGWVDLSFMLTPDGKVVGVSVVDSMPHRIFDRAAREALSRTRFRPFLQDGHAIAVASRLRVSFRLANP